MKASISFYCRSLFLLSLALVAAAELLSPPGGQMTPSDVAAASFTSSGGWCALVFLLIALSTGERLRLIGVTLACGAVGAMIGAARGGFGAQAIETAKLGVSSAPYLFCMAMIAFSSGTRRGRWIDLACASSLMYVLTLLNPFFLDRLAHWSTRIFDNRIALYDEAFGIQTSGVMALAFKAAPWLHNLSLAAYCVIPLAVVVVGAFEWRRADSGSFSVIPAFIVAAIIGSLCYCLTPAIGPREYFGASFPLLHATADFLARQPMYDFGLSPRNAMPSLHMTWALLAFLHTRSLPIWGRAYAGFFVFLTLCATLGFGEHYLLDLVVAAPLVTLVRSLCAGGLGWADPARARGVLVGLALLGAWIYVIRSEQALAPAAVLALAVLTIGASSFFELALARAEKTSGRAAPAAAEDSPSIPLDVAV